jgi:hypothetical protein
MYDPNCLEWHLDDGNEVRPPQVSVWSCKVAGEAFALISNRLAAALPRAKTTEKLLGVFAFADRTPHEVGAASGAARKETATRYAARLGGSSRTIRAAGRIIKPRGVR